MVDEEWGENEKRLHRGSQRKENGGYFSYSYDRVGGAGRLLVSLYDDRPKLVCDVVRSVLHGVGVSAQSTEQGSVCSTLS